MSISGLKDLFVQGLRAVHAADEQGRVTAGDIAKAATNPELKAALHNGGQTAQALGKKLAQVFEAAGASPSHLKNAAIEGIATDAQHVRESMADPQGRDLGIIAHAKIALHYYMAAYGTLRTYAQALGIKEAAQTLDSMLHEVSQQDQKFGQLAHKVIG